MNPYSPESMGFDDHLTKPVPGFSVSRKEPSYWIQRLGSLITDILVFDILVAAPLSSFLPQSISFGNAISNKEYFAALIIIIFFFSYLTISQYLTGQTLGMMLFRIKTVSKDGSFWRFIVRNLYILPFFPIILLWIIDAYYLLRWGVRWSEIISGTRIETEKVIKRGLLWR